MRVLKFVVDKQIINQDPDCDFSNLIPGSEGYLQAEFTFSDDWDNCVKVASFCSSMGTEFPPQILKDGQTCMIPAEALKFQIFKVGVIGKKDGFKLTTDKVMVRQKG